MFLYLMFLYDHIMRIFDFLFIGSLEPSSVPGIYQILYKCDFTKWLYTELIE
jgi:hypothetical protein